MCVSPWALAIQVSLLSWGSVSWTPPSMRPSSPWGQTQLLGLPVIGWACAMQRTDGREPPGSSVGCCSAWLPTCSALPGSPSPGLSPARLAAHLELCLPVLLGLTDSPLLCARVPWLIPPGPQPPSPLPHRLVSLAEPTPELPGLACCLVHLLPAFGPDAGSAHPSPSPRSRPSALLRLPAGPRDLGTAPCWHAASPNHLQRPPPVGLSPGSR